MGKRRQLRGFDLKQIEGVASLIGVDEVGRGAFAGPVVAAAVMVTRDFLESRWAVGRAGRRNQAVTAELLACTDAPMPSGSPSSCMPLPIAP